MTVLTTTLHLDDEVTHGLGKPAELRNNASEYPDPVSSWKMNLRRLGVY
jgi:hypothetical protein